MQGLIILLLPLTITAKQYLVESKNSLEPLTPVLRSFLLLQYVSLQSLIKKGGENKYFPYVCFILGLKIVQFC
jgi:hypothetical protein